MKLDLLPFIFVFLLASADPVVARSTDKSQPTLEMRLAEIKELDFSKLTVDELSEIVAGLPKFDPDVHRRIAERTLESKRADLFLLMLDGSKRSNMWGAALNTFDSSSFKDALVVEVLRKPWPEDHPRLFGSDSPNSFLPTCLRHIHKRCPQLMGDWREPESYTQVKTLELRNGLADRFAAALNIDALPVGVKTPNQIKAAEQIQIDSKGVSPADIPDRSQAREQRGFSMKYIATILIVMIAGVVLALWWKSS